MNKNRKNTLECAQKLKDLLYQNQTYRIIIKSLIEEDNNIFLDFCMTFFIGSNSFILKELNKVDNEIKKRDNFTLHILDSENTLLYSDLIINNETIYNYFLIVKYTGSPTKNK
jgi:hypothetical protein